MQPSALGPVAPLAGSPRAPQPSAPSASTGLARSTAQHACVIFSHSCVQETSFAIQLVPLTHALVRETRKHAITRARNKQACNHAGSRRPLARISFSKTKDQVLLGAYPLEQLNETVRNNLNGITRYHLWERRAIAQKEAESDEWERARTGAGTNSTTGEWGRRRTEKGQGWGAGRKGGRTGRGARGGFYHNVMG